MLTTGKVMIKTSCWKSNDDQNFMLKRLEKSWRCWSPEGRNSMRPTWETWPRWTDVWHFATGLHGLEINPRKGGHVAKEKGGNFW